ncbi:MAG: ParA family protein [Pseudomonadota bacterium]
MTHDPKADLAAPHKIVILNPKGGSGKTTLATNIAAYYALEGPPPTLIDCDPGGYSMRWVDSRSPDRPPVYGIAAYDQGGANAGPIGAWPESKTVIVDLPAGLQPHQYFRQTYDADSILIPVLPSEIDIYSATRFIADLLLVAQFDRRNRSLAIVANRTRHTTRSYRMLKRFLQSLEIPVVTELRDSQAYVHAAAQGIGIIEMPRYLVGQDIDGLAGLFGWLERYRTRRIDGLIVEELRQRPEMSLTGARPIVTH